MPNIIVKTPKGVFDPAARARLALGVTVAAKTVEQSGDDPMQELLTWVVVEEMDAFFVGGREPLDQVIPVIVLFLPPAGVVDDAARANAVRLMHDAISAAKPQGDPRAVMTSIIVSDVADGTWGANGTLWRLPDFARSAGYKHLQHLVMQVHSGRMR